MLGGKCLILRGDTLIGAARRWRVKLWIEGNRGEGHGSVGVDWLGKMAKRNMD